MRSEELCFMLQTENHELKKRIYELESELEKLKQENEMLKE
jgi:cell division protein FtsB